jgi:hypothetical protein
LIFVVLFLRKAGAKRDTLPPSPQLLRSDEEEGAVEKLDTESPEELPSSK